MLLQRLILLVVHILLLLLLRTDEALLMGFQMFQERVLIVVASPTELAIGMVQRNHPRLFDLPICQVTIELRLRIESLLTQQTPPIIQT